MTTDPTTKPLNLYGVQLHRRHLLGGLTVLFVCLGLIFAIYWFTVGQYVESTDDAYVGGYSVQVMSQVPGHVIKVYVDETALVRKGELLVELDPADAEIALNAAQAQLALVTRQVSQYFDKVNQAKANVAVEEDNLRKATNDYDRRKKLVVNNSISQEDLQHSQIALQAATDSLVLAKQQLASALTLVGNTDLYHHPEVEQAIVNVRNAYLQWRRTSIYAPVTGEVAKRTVQLGQQINTSTVLMIIVPLSDVWVDANFKESQLKNIRVGQAVTLSSDTYGGSIKFQGTVVGLSPGTGSAFDILPAQNATGNWIKIIQRLPVRIALDAKQIKEFPLRKGESMTVTVDTHDRKGNVLNKSNLLTTSAYSENDDRSFVMDADKRITTILENNAKNISPVQER